MRGYCYPAAGKVGEILRRLEEDGWYLVATRGSHRQYKHGTKAIEFHLAGLLEDGGAIPPPTSRVDYVEVAA